MIIKSYSSAIVLSFIMLSIPLFAFAGQKNNPESKFLIGLKGGLNLSQQIILEQFQVFSNLSEDDAGAKEYNTIWKNLGIQYGFVGLYRLHKKLNLIIEPTFSNYKYGYKSITEWQDNSGTILTSSQNHTQNLHYFELPIIIQYFFDQRPVKPYFLIGGYYGYLLGAEKVINIDEYISINGQRFKTASEHQHVYFNDQYIKSRFAGIAGTGAIYDLTAMQLMFGVSYHFSLNNISRENARFSNQLITGSAYDINDNIRLNTIEFNLRILFPINKPSSLFKSLKCK